MSEDPDGSFNPLRAELRQAVEGALARAGFVVVVDPAAPPDAEARVSVAAFSAGVVVRGSGMLTVAAGGSVIDQVATEPETYRRGNFARLVADRLVERLAHSTRWLAFTGAGLPPAAPAPPALAAAASLGKAGAFGKGINLEAALVAVQALGPGGAEAGAGLAVIPQFDLGPRWAFRVPITVDATFASSPGGFADISLTPGLVHRWRTHQDQTWIPYLGGGLKLGSFGAGHALLGLPSVAVAGVFIGHHHLDLDGGNHADDPDFEVGLRVAPELWAGLEVHPCSWFSVDLGATYAWVRLSGENLHLLREVVGLRLSF